jgi:hypothetical protein
MMVVVLRPVSKSIEDANICDYQWCTEMVMPASKDGGE